MILKHADTCLLAQQGVLQGAVIIVSLLFSFFIIIILFFFRLLAQQGVLQGACVGRVSMLEGVYAGSQLFNTRFYFPSFCEPGKWEFVSRD